MAKSWREVLVAPTASVREVLQVIDRGALQIALVVDANDHLLGTVTDGDIRRGLLRGLTLEHPVRELMNPEPTTARRGEGRDAILRLMSTRGFKQIPVLDEAGRLCDIQILESLLGAPVIDTCVVLMAGGLGKRLRPLTDDLPKPMLPVGGRPVLETALTNFVAQGFRRFLFCVNYKAELIEAHFGDGSSWGVEIRYVREPEAMGTGGALSLLPERPDSAFIVMNGDVLTTVDFRQLLGFHREHSAAATMGVRIYDFQVPYGVARVEDNRLVGFEEKPVQSFFVNAGIYVIEPRVLERLARGVPFDMPVLLEQVRDAGEITAVFPVREYWLDMGGHDDLRRANHEFDEVFG